MMTSGEEKGIALYRYGYLGVVFGWTIAAILLVGLVAWAFIARLIKVRLMNS